MDSHFVSSIGGKIVRCQNIIVKVQMKYWDQAKESYGFYHRYYKVEGLPIPEEVSQTKLQSCDLWKSYETGYKITLRQKRLSFIKNQVSHEEAREIIGKYREAWKPGNAEFLVMAIKARMHPQRAHSKNWLVLPLRVMLTNEGWRWVQQYKYADIEFYAMEDKRERNPNYRLTENKNQRQVWIPDKDGYPCIDVTPKKGSPAPQLTIELGEKAIGVDPRIPARNVTKIGQDRMAKEEAEREERNARKELESVKREARKKKNEEDDLRIEKAIEGKSGAEQMLALLEAI